MKRCIETHNVAGFGEIPAGSLWDDDSPFVQRPECFETADALAKPTRKADGKTVEVAVDPTITEEG